MGVGAPGTGREGEKEAGWGWKGGRNGATQGATQQGLPCDILYAWRCIRALLLLPVRVVCEYRHVFLCFTHCCHTLPSLPCTDTCAGEARFTVKGSRCLFPISYGGTLQYDCILVGGTPSCPTGPRGQLEECAPPGHLPGGSAAAGSGTDAGMGSSSASSGDAGSSSGDGGSGYISGTGSGTSDATLGATLVYPLGVLPRYTASGQQCADGFTVGGANFRTGECAWVGGAEVCQVQGSGDLLECAPLVQLAPDTTVCHTNAVSLGVSPGDTAGGVFTECVSQLGLEFCQMASAAGAGAWVRCPYQPQRITLNGVTCQLPFTLGGLVRTDCVRQGSPDTTSETQYCPAMVNSSDGNGQTLYQQLQLTKCMPQEAYAGDGVTGPSSSDASSKPRGLARDWQLLQGLVPHPGTGTRRYTLTGQSSCLPLTNPSAVGVEQLLEGTGSSSSAAGGSGGDGGNPTPPAGSSVCILDADRGRFECSTEVRRWGILVHTCVQERQWVCSCAGLQKGRL
jgi:hypothetical protein